MINPLRCPLVLFVVVVGLAVFVHRHPAAPTLRRSTSEPAAIRDSDDSLQLRKDDERHLTVDVASSVTPRLSSVTPAIIPLVPNERGTTLARDVPVPPVLGRQELSPLPALAPLPSVMKEVEPLTTRPALPQEPSVIELPRIESLSSAPPGPSAQPVSDRQPTMHRIVDGDTLRDLAARYLGDESRYLEIYEANRDLLRHPELLPLGSKLRIPDRTVTFP